MELSGVVGLFVCSSHHSPAHAVAAGLLLSAVSAGDVDRQRRAPAQQQGLQQQTRAVSRLQPSYKAEHEVVIIVA